MKSSILQNNPKLAVLMGLIVAVIVLGGALMLRDKLASTGSSASCYGYSCEPSVILWAWPAYGSQGDAVNDITVNPGSLVYFSWLGENVDKCKAEKNWTKFTGTYLPPFLYTKPITQTQVFTVSCTVNNRVVARSSVTVFVKSPDTK